MKTSKLSNGILPMVAFNGSICPSGSKVASRCYLEKVTAFTQDGISTRCKRCVKGLVRKHTSSRALGTWCEATTWRQKSSFRAKERKDGSWNSRWESVEVWVDVWKEGGGSRRRRRETPWAQPTFLIWWSIITLCGFTSRCMIPILWQ